MAHNEPLNISKQKINFNSKVAPPPLETLLGKNHENPINRKSQPWAPLNNICHNDDGKPINKKTVAN